MENTKKITELLESQSIFPVHDREFVKVRRIMISDYIDGSDLISSTGYVYIEEFQNACWALDVAEKEIMKLRKEVEVAQLENQQLQLSMQHQEV